jgi:hypothetical protein
LRSPIMNRRLRWRGAVAVFDSEFCDGDHLA